MAVNIVMTHRAINPVAVRETPSRRMGHPFEADFR